MVKECRVTIKGQEGSIHTVRVTADSLNEAVIRAEAAFQQQKEFADLVVWRDAQFEVTVCELEVKHTVPLSRAHEWLKKNGGSPREVALKSRLKELLEAATSF